MHLLDQSFEDGTYHNDDEVPGLERFPISQVLGIDWSTGNSLHAGDQDFAPALLITVAGAACSVDRLPLPNARTYCIITKLTLLRSQAADNSLQLAYAAVCCCTTALHLCQEAVGSSGWQAKAHDTHGTSPVFKPDHRAETKTLALGHTCTKAGLHADAARGKAAAGQAGAATPGGQGPERSHSSAASAGGRFCSE